MANPSPATSLLRLEARDGVLHVNGPLVFDTVPDALSRSLALLPSAGRIAIDLAGVSHADSAALALLVEWQRAAQGRGLDLRALPTQLLALASATGLDTLVAARP